MVRKTISPKALLGMSFITTSVGYALHPRSRTARSVVGRERCSLEAKPPSGTGFSGPCGLSRGNRTGEPPLLVPDCRVRAVTGMPWSVPADGKPSSVRYSIVRQLACATLLTASRGRLPRRDDDALSVALPPAASGGRPADMAGIKSGMRPECQPMSGGSESARSARKLKSVIALKAPDPR